MSRHPATSTIRIQDQQLGPPLAADSVSISTTFHAQNRLRDQPPNIVLVAADGVQFYAHLSTLLASSVNGFGGKLPLPSDRDALLHVPISSDIFNIILLTAYRLSCADFSPSFEQLRAAVNLMPMLGLPPSTYVTHDQPLYAVLLSYASHNPFDVYILAGSHDLFALAQATSSHLLSKQLDTISDEEAVAMGSVYLKRLFLLHHNRTKTLQRLLGVPPPPHEGTTTCGSRGQQQLTSAWAHTSASILWQIRPGKHRQLVR
ncbi:hypothetical protein HGRIS_014113 [Hohenbuehelia grisea]|uniref:BTB domain-containing protein n=1 Tax=Hohenbuehelia grisea TaxID=104357 RepID=A0ABR3JU35_9AGAR